MVGTESFPNQVVAELAGHREEQLGDWRFCLDGDGLPRRIGHRALAALRSGQGQRCVFTPPYPWFNSYCGDIDLIGNKKPQSYFRDVVWRRSKIEMAVQRPHPAGLHRTRQLWGWSDELRSWTWPGFEGTR